MLITRCFYNLLCVGDFFTSDVTEVLTEAISQVDFSYELLYGIREILSRNTQVES